MKRTAGRTWDLVVLDDTGSVQQLEVLLEADPWVGPAGQLVIRERLTGEVARVWAAGRWLAYSREFTTDGRYPEDEIGNYPHGRKAGGDEG
jgi:hypothetical protein